MEHSTEVQVDRQVVKKDTSTLRACLRALSTDRLMLDHLKTTPAGETPRCLAGLQSIICATNYANQRQ